MPEHSATVDEETLVVLRAVAEAAQLVRVAWLVTGAAGRILLLERVYGGPAGRATMDLDFGVMVRDWDQYARLREAVCRDPRFRPDPRQAQRVHGPGGRYLDLIPFGGVETSEGIVRWPPDGDIRLRVTGFEDACRHAAVVVVNDGACRVPVVTPEHLVSLKLFAWKDRRLTDPRKDAADLAYVLGHPAAWIGEERLFDSHFDVVETAGYDTDLAAARVLGRTLATQASPTTRTRLAGLLSEELARGEDSDLVRDVGRELMTGPARAFALLDAFRQGVQGA